MHPDEDPKNLSLVLDKIHDIAAKAAAEENVPQAVDEALSAIISLSRYKMDVLGNAHDTFDVFLEKWTLANIGSLGDHTDPSDWDYFSKRKAAELDAEAASKGFRSQLHQTAEAYRGTAGYVRYLYERATYPNRY